MIRNYIRFLGRFKGMPHGDVAGFIICAASTVLILFLLYHYDLKESCTEKAFQSVAWVLESISKCDIVRVQIIQVSQEKFLLLRSWLVLFGQLLVFFEF